MFFCCLFISPIAGNCLDGGLLSTSKARGASYSPTDTVIPMFCFDDNSINRSVLLDITLRFDNVLDLERLRQSLGRLMEPGDLEEAWSSSAEDGNLLPSSAGFILQTKQLQLQSVQRLS